MRLNNIQIVSLAISGYEPYKSFSSACWSKYYDLTNKQDKLDEIIAYAENMIEPPIFISNEEAIDIYNFLEKDFLGENQRFYAFEKL